MTDTYPSIIYLYNEVHSRTKNRLFNCGDQQFNSDDQYISVSSLYERDLSLIQLKLATAESASLSNWELNKKRIEYILGIPKQEIR